MSNPWNPNGKLIAVHENEDEILSVALYDDAEAYEARIKKENRHIDICFLILKWSALFFCAALVVRLGYWIADLISRIGTMPQ